MSVNSADWYRSDVSAGYLEPFDYESVDFDDILGEGNGGCIVD